MHNLSCLIILIIVICTANYVCCLVMLKVQTRQKLYLFVLPVVQYYSCYTKTKFLKYLCLNVICILFLVSRKKFSQLARVFTGRKKRNSSAKAILQEEDSDGP